MVNVEPPTSPVTRNPYRYLIVDEYTRGMAESAALHLAFTSGLIDHLATEGATVARRQLTSQRSTMRILLEHNGVIERHDDRLRLTPRFRTVVNEFRDLLETKLYFAMKQAQALTGSPEQALHVGRVDATDEPDYLRLFQYQRTDSTDPEEIRATTDWVRFMTMLTKYEAPVGLERYDFGVHHRMMDIGGNSGEFVFNVVGAVPTIDAIVFDLPGVVDRGQDWNRHRSGAERVRFHTGDAFVDPLPGGCDLISFKGVLHDWPNRQASVLVRRAWEALEPGGTLMIFERSRLRDEDIVPMHFGRSTIAMWMWVFQGPDRYVTWLERLGAESINVDTFNLDLPWMLLTARKPRPSTVT